jgi:catechol 2,3-dioxygenase-like lactoylglutathione lyase family enzyme
MHDPDRRREIAHVGPVELFTSVLEESRDFFVDVMGLREVHRDDTSVYLHTWDDYQSWTIRLVRREAAGIGRTYLRAGSPQGVDRLAAEIDAAGLGRGVVSDVHNLGEVHLFADPDGHEFVKDDGSPQAVWYNVATRPTTWCPPRTKPAAAAACTTSPSPPTPARRSSGRGRVPRRGRAHRDRTARLGRRMTGMRVALLGSWVRAGGDQDPTWTWVR